VLIVVRAKAVLLPRGQDVVDSAQQGRRHGDYRERKEMSSRPERKPDWQVGRRKIVLQIVP
jgi:hypothetical protein